MTEKKNPEIDRTDIEEAMKSYYQDEPVKALIGLKVDTKYTDEIARAVSSYENILDVYLVTGDMDLLLKGFFENFKALKDFLVVEIPKINGVKETKTLQVVTTFKEDGKVMDL